MLAMVIGLSSSRLAAGRSRSLDVLGPLAKGVLLRLARRGLRQGTEDHVLGSLVMGEVLPAPRDEVARPDPRWGETPCAFVTLKPDDHGRFHHGRVTIECLLDLERRDVLPARDDDVLGAVLDLDVAVRMPDAEVSRV